MIKKENRLCKSEDFAKIIHKRKQVSSKYFVVYYEKNNESKSRVGISVSKKLGNAVIRNKIKRQVRHMTHALTIENLPLNMVIIIRKDYLSQSFDKNKKDLDLLIKKVKMITGQ